MAQFFGPGGQFPPSLRGRQSGVSPMGRGLLESTPVGMPITHGQVDEDFQQGPTGFTPGLLADGWDVKHTKSPADIAEIIWPDGTKGDNSGSNIVYTVPARTGNQAVIKFKDKTRQDQVHSFGAGGQVTLAGGVYHFPRGT